MKKLFISQPMRGKEKGEILKIREEIIKKVKEIVKEDIVIIDSFHNDYPGEINKNIPIWYLSKSIEYLSQADIVYFACDWRNYRGCNIENTIAKEYGLQVIEE